MSGEEEKNFEGENKERCWMLYAERKILSGFQTV
jgi:hypothetical protein